MTGNTIEIVIKGSNQAGKPITEVNKSLGVLDKSAGNVTTTFSKLSSAMGNVALTAATGLGVAALALGAGVVAAVGQGISKAIDLDQQMANIAATMGATKETAGTLKAELADLAFDLSLDPNLTVNLKQAGEALEVLAANGAIATDEFGRITQASKDLTAQTVALANATGSDFATAAAIATDASNIFGLGADELGRAVDGAAGVMNASKFDAIDYGLALANAGSVFAGMGGSIEDLNTVIAGTANSFSSGSDAGTSFKSLMQRLANPTAKMKKVMEEYDLSLFNADGSMRDMSEVAGQLNSAFSGLTEAKRAEVAATLGGADASRILLGLASMTSEEFITLSEQVNRTGQGLAAAATRVDTVSGAWDIFLGIIEAVQVQIGMTFLPLIKDILVSFSRLASEAGPQVIAFFTDVAANVTAFIAKAQELFAIFQSGGMAAVLETLGQDLLSGWNTTILPILQSWGIQFWDWLTLTALPLAGQKIGELVSVIGQFLAEQWTNTVMPTLAEWSNLFWNWLGSAYAAAPAKLTELIRIITDTLVTNWPTIQAELMTWGQKIWEWTGVAAAAAGQALAAILVSIVTWATSSETQAELLRLGTLIGEWIVTGLGAIGENQGKTNTALLPVLASIGQGLVVGVAAIAGTLIIVGGQIVAGIASGILESFGVDLEPATFNELSAILTGIGANIVTIASVVGTNIVTGISAGVTSMQQSLEDSLFNMAMSAIDSVKSVFGISSPSTVFMDFGMNMIQGMIAGIQSMGGALLSEIGSLLGGLLGGGGEGGGGAAATLFDPATTLAGVQAVQVEFTNLQAQIGALTTTVIPAFQQAALTALAAITVSIIILTTETLVLLQTTWLTFTTLATQAMVMLLTTGIMPVDAALIVIIGSTLPTLLTTWVSAATSMTTSLQPVKAMVEQINTLLQEMIALAKTAGEAVSSAMTKAAESFGKAASKVKDLIAVIKDAVTAFDKMAAAARAAASASSAAGATAPGGGKSGGGKGFASGTGPSGFTVPAGFPNDSFKIGLTSGEHFEVTPRGGPGERNSTTIYNFTQNVHTQATTSTVISDFNVMRSLLGA